MSRPARGHMGTKDSPAGSPGGPPRRPDDTEVRAARINAKAVIAAAVIAGVFALAANSLTNQLKSGSAQPAAPATAGATHQSPAQPAGATPAAGKVLRHAKLVLLGNGTAYDLDSAAAGWDPLANHSWITQNIAYLPHGYNSRPLVELAGSPGTDVVMAGKGPWSYQDCANAPYFVNSSTTGPNVITGPALDTSRGICVTTQDTGSKKDGNHYVLLVVLGQTSSTLTLEVTVWQ